jgi:hypothetical protein
MGTHPHALRGDVAQQGVKTGAVSAVLNRVDPDQHAVHCEQLFADGVGEAFVVDRGAPIDADGGERYEDVDKAASPRERMAMVRRGEGCLSVSMRKLHVLRAAQNLDRSLAGSLLVPGPTVYVRSLESFKCPFYGPEFRPLKESISFH